MTVDAVYLTDPNFLAEAASALARTGADYVQFPQSYMRQGNKARGVDLELEEYFRTDAKMADEAEAVLLTGSLCAISRTALVAVGGWSARTTTGGPTGRPAVPRGFSWSLHRSRCRQAGFATDAG